jgi:hypothetical protein
VKLYNVNAYQLEEVVHEVSARLYKGNLIFKELQGKSTHTKFTLRVADSNGPGARRSAAGARMVSACWHAHKDVMAALFERHSDARLVSSLATYHGKADFEAKHANTGGNNIGCQAAPVALEDACLCNGHS